MNIAGGSIKIEITQPDGVRYVIELEDCQPADIELRRDEIELPSDDGWLHRIAGDTATVTLLGHGHLISATRLSP